ncbi:hypothetical protein D3C75_784790 [compost metagenome]
MLLQGADHILQTADGFVEGMYRNSQPLRKLLPVEGSAGQHQQAQELDFLIEAFFGHDDPPFLLAFIVAGVPMDGNGKVSVVVILTPCSAGPE